MLGATAASLPPHSLSFPTRTCLRDSNNPLFFSPPSTAQGSGSNGEKPNPASIFLSRHGRTGLSVFASRRRRGQSGNGVSETDGWEDDDGWEDEEGEGEGEALTPFEDMRRWLRNKPTGFGEGKTYDTMLEEKLLEEMEQSRKAQLANLNKLKDSPTNATATNKPQTKVTDVLPCGTRVRVGNLPRKKNIHRDLKWAFKGFPGIVNISPAVTGSKKTRDPVCKGFAFIDLDSEETAIRFVQAHSKQSLLFGKIQKQITCDIVNPSPSSNSSSKHVDGESCAVTPQICLADMAEETKKVSALVRHSWDPQESNSEVSDGIAIPGNIEEESEAVMDGRDGQPLSTQQDGEMDIRYFDTTILGNDVVIPRNADNLDREDSSSPMQKQKSRVVSKKKTVKQKASKPSILGSAIRLKVKERTVLTGVFSKYGGKAAPAFAKES